MRVETAGTRKSWATMFSLVISEGFVERRRLGAASASEKAQYSTGLSEPFP